MEREWIAHTKEVDMSLVAEPAHVNRSSRLEHGCCRRRCTGGEPRHREERSRTAVFEGMVGTSPGMCEVRSSICRVAPMDSTVLIRCPHSGQMFTGGSSRCFRSSHRT